MYISQDEHNSVNIDALNAKSPDYVTWHRGYQNEEVIEIGFDLDDNLEEVVITDILQELMEDMEDKVDFMLTGVEYDIWEHAGLLVFSDISKVETNVPVGVLLENLPDSIMVPKTLAIDGITTCTGVFAAFYDWGYEPVQIRFVQDEGLFLTGVPVF